MSSMFIRFPTIEQYRKIINEISKRVTYYNKNTDGSKISHPIITFIGTVKLHGTNSSFCYQKSEDKFWVQSRNRILTVDRDNAGFCEFINSNLLVLKKIANKIYEQEQLDDTTIVTIYGEWCGPGIQNKVAIAKIPNKSFVIFDVKITTIDEKNRWAKLKNLRSIPNYSDENVYNIFNFPTWRIEIDTSNPNSYQNTLIEITEQVEKECPVAKEIGISGCGEGVVWTFYDNSNKTNGIYNDRTRFKVKGVKHSVTKVKKLASVDIERLNSIHEAVSNLATDNRIDQAVDVVIKENSEEPSITHLGKIIQWVLADIGKEESDTLEASGFTLKDISKKVSIRVREYYMQNYL